MNALSAVLAKGSCLTARVRRRVASIPVTTSDDALDTTTVRLVGDLDMEAAGDVLSQILTCGTASTVAADLSAVDFIDSSGLRTLLTATRRAHQHHTQVRLRNVGGAIRRMLQITGTSEQFEIEE